MLSARNTAPGGAVPHCTTCERTAVVNAAEAGVEFERARDWLRRQGVIINHPNLRFNLISGNELGRMVKQNGGHAFGATTARWSAGRCQEITISMRSGLPKAMFAGACAHELGHAWLNAQGIHGLPPVDEEGFCELLSWRYFRACDTPEAKYHATRIFESPHPIYGAGFRKVHGLCQRLGLAQLINLTAYHRRLPQ
jgi:hypothetical protein